MTPEEERKTWQYRAVEATQGSSTMMGTLLLAVIGRGERVLPRYSACGQITADGYVLANLMGRNGDIYRNSPVGRIEEVRDNFRRLADTIKATDTERTEMMEALKRWIVRDARAVSELS